MSEPVLSLISSIEEVENQAGHVISERIGQFLDLNRKGNEEWFSELCFCILTANSSAELGIKIQNEIGDGFLYLSEGELEKELKRLGHRFWRTRAEFIVRARKFSRIRDIVVDSIESSGVIEAREWLVKNIKGIGYKEASHFLRNVGYFDLAILDRHILAVMHKYGILDEIPKTLTKKRYLEIEQKFVEIADLAGMKPGILDLYVWYMRTGRVLK
ncbi:N-glycosylase/DNA lyase [Geoglobus acetivorans]|uniref:8-oxoguanine DNA glycosylase/AP lyase n=1 Tax=Geoglobus acetivorans TaxID=565033 RepID=A0A0A7GCJ5_GEOAI|nr:8-oxoguanine-DNA-glycosylase [Geoglobus acetivorans]